MAENIPSDTPGHLMLVISNCTNDEATTNVVATTAINPAVVSSLPSNFRLFPNVGLSGSAQPCRKQFERLLQTIRQGSLSVRRGGSIVILDLRQETHGFVSSSGEALSWFAERDWGNVKLGGNQPALIERYHQQFALASRTQATFYHVTLDSLDIGLASCFPIGRVVGPMLFEEQEMDTYNLGYKWLPLSDHLPPPTGVLDQIFTWVTKLPVPRPHIHVHCRAGDGRTTTYLFVLDLIMRTLDDSVVSLPSFDELIAFQQRMGGIDLAEIPDNWKKPYFEERQASLLHFYYRMAHLKAEQRHTLAHYSSNMIHFGPIL